MANSPTARVDTPYTGSYADQMAKRLPATGIFPPATMPVGFEEAQRLLNIQRRAGAEGGSPHVIASATAQEDRQFPPAEYRLGQ